MNCLGLRDACASTPVLGAGLFLCVSGRTSACAVAPPGLVVSLELFPSEKRPWEEPRWVGTGHT